MYASLEALMNEHGNTAPIIWNTEKPTRDGALWFVGHEWPFKGKTCRSAYFGDMHTSGQWIEWKSWEKESFTKAENKELTIYIEKQREDMKAAREAYQMEVAGLCELEFKKFLTTGRTPYMDRKKVKELYGARLSEKNGEGSGELILAVPLRDTNGFIWNYQRIFNEKIEVGKSKTDKLFQKGARKAGCFHVLNEEGTAFDWKSISHTMRILICEGFATAASAFEAMPEDVVVAAFDAGNLLPVAVAIREAVGQGPEIIIAADNDAFTTINGKKVNVGIRDGKLAAKAVNGRCVWPTFKDAKPALSDFNDLANEDGSGEVRRQIEEGTKGSGEAPDTKYQVFKEFFDVHLADAKKDIVRNKLLYFDGMFWQSVFNKLGVLRSLALDAGAKPSHIGDALERYEYEAPKQLLCDVPSWDGRDRIAELKQFITFKGHSFETFEAVFKDWGATIFRRLYDKDVQNRCIILKGEQEKGKDSLIRELLRGFGPYYAKFSNSRDEREIWQQVVVNLVIHIEEFEQTGNLSVALIKDLITRDIATHRAPYAHAESTRRCIGSFISTINLDAPLRDETGNRRFAVFEVVGIDWKYPKDQGAQIVAQFKALYDQGFRASPEIWTAVKEGNKEFEQVDMNAFALELWDVKVNEIIKDGMPDGYSAETGIPLIKIEHVIDALAKATGIRHRALLTLLRTSGRAKRFTNGMRYFQHRVVSLAK